MDRRRRGRAGSATLWKEGRTVTGLGNHRTAPFHRPQLLLAAADGTLEQNLRRYLGGRLELLDGVPRDVWVVGAVLGFPGIREPETRRRIRSTREAIRPSPCVLITSNQTAHLLSLSELVVERVHPLEGGLVSLPEVAGAMLEADPPATLARTVEAWKGMDPLVRSAMVLILRSRSPLGSVKRLCCLLEVEKSTPYDHSSAVAVQGTLRSRSSQRVIPSSTGRSTVPVSLSHLVLRNV